MDPAPAAPPDAGRTLAEIAAAWWDHVLDESPSMCTSLGIDRGLDRLEQDDEAGRARRAAFREQTRRRLEAVAPDALGTEERLTRTVMHRLLTEADEEERHRFFEWSLNPLFGPHLSLQELAELAPIDGHRVEKLQHESAARGDAAPHRFEQRADGHHFGLPEETA